jgi:transposase
MERKRKKYTREFKLEAVRLSEESELSLVELAAELGIHANTLSKWRREYAVDGQDAFPGQGNLKPADEEVRRLQRELARVKEERDILKKAISYFVRESR